MTKENVQEAPVSCKREGTGDSFPQRYWTGPGPKEPAAELERVVNKNIRLSGRFPAKGWGNGLHEPLGTPGSPIPRPPHFLPVFCRAPGIAVCSNTCLVAADVLGLNKNQIALIRLQADTAICQTQKCPSA